MTIRVIKGQLSRRKIIFHLRNTRPMMHYIKTMVFNVLPSLRSINNIKVLDLFAGTGQLGIECLSRGAQRVFFVDQNPRAVQKIAQNLQTFRIPVAQYDLFVGDFRTFLQQYYGILVQLVFLDPPFIKMHFIKCALKMIIAQKIIQTGSIIVIQTGVPLEAFPSSLKLQ